MTCAHTFSPAKRFFYSIWPSNKKKFGDPWPRKYRNCSCYFYSSLSSKSSNIFADSKQ